MACDVKKMLDIAKSQIGYIEKETWAEQDDFTANAGDENYNKYSRDLAKVNYFNSSKKGVAWCAIFAAWPYVQAYGKKAALKLLCQPASGNAGAGCNSAMEYFKAKGQFYETDPEPGDLIFFWNAEKTEASHVGIVEKDALLYVHTIEGNTSGKADVDENGGEVAAKKYKYSAERIAGYGRPAWDEVDPDPGYEGSDIAFDENMEVEIMKIGTAMVVPKTGKAVNFRTNPSKTAGRVSGCKQIDGREIVDVITIDGEWAHIAYDGFEGYMMVEFLAMNGSESDGEFSSERTITEIVDEIMALVQEIAARAE